MILFWEMQLEESNQVHGQQLWEHNNNLLSYERQPEVQPSIHSSNVFFHPLDAAGEPTLHIGYLLSSYVWSLIYF